MSARGPLVGTLQLVVGALKRLVVLLERSVVELESTVFLVRLAWQRDAAQDGVERLLCVARELCAERGLRGRHFDLVSGSRSALLPTAVAQCQILHECESAAVDEAF